LKKVLKDIKKRRKEFKESKMNDFMVWYQLEITFIIYSDDGNNENLTLIYNVKMSNS
jgi:hypothetical protein